MKKVLGIAILAVVAPLFCGCDDKEYVFTSQQTAIVRYLTSTRRLIAEAEVGDVVEDNPAFYTEHGRSAYRHIPNYYTAGREELAEIEHGDKVAISFDAYIFSGSEPAVSSVYWSNNAATIDRLVAISGNLLAKPDWSTEPLEITIGKTKVIRGVEQALVGCREQDSVQIYMTYNMAYGDKLVGIVPKHSSVAWYIKILNVTK